MQIHVDFKALQTGDHSRHMILHYDTGCILYVFVLISMDVISNFKENSVTEILDLWCCLHCGGNIAEWLGQCMDLKSGDPELKSCSEHQLDLSQVVPGFNSLSGVTHIAHCSFTCQFGFLTCSVDLLYSVDTCMVDPYQPEASNRPLYSNCCVLSCLTGLWMKVRLELTLL